MIRVKKGSIGAKNRMKKVRSYIGNKKLSKMQKLHLKYKKSIKK